MSIKTVGVLGCGLMGSGIAQVCAAAGYKTVVREVDDALAAEGARPHQEVSRRTESPKGRSTAADRDKTLGNLSGTTTFDALGGCDLVIEAIVENLEEKRADLRRARARSESRRDHRARTHHRCASLSSRRRRSGPTVSAGCTSSTPCRS